MIYKRSVVLSSVDNGKEKGVLTLEVDSGEIYGNLKLYNFNKEPEGILSLGILNDNRVIKAGLTKEKDNFYTFKTTGQNELSSFSCALVNLKNGEAKALLKGTTNGTVTSEERLVNSFSIFENEPSVSEVETTLNENDIYLEEQEEIERLIDEEIGVSSCDNRCSECKYRDAFFKLADDESEPEKKEETFYDEIKEQIDTLFKKYPEEEILKELIPDSKWTKIDYENNGEHYVVGLLYEQGKVKYVCYGVPGVYGMEPPKELKGFCQWLPIDSQKEKGFGYWITYQDAETGENVVIEYETV